MPTSGNTIKVAETGADSLPAAAPAWLLRSLDRMKQGILIIDAEPEDPRIVFVNERICQSTGYSREELIGQSPWILHGPETNQAEVERLSSLLRQGGEYRGELRYYRRDGSSDVADWEVSSVASPHGVVTHFVAEQSDSIGAHRPAEAEALRQTNDDLERSIRERTTALADLARRMSSEVEERARSEEALRLSEQRFRTLCERVPVGVFLADPMGHCIYTNPRLQAFNEATSDELLGDGYVRRIHPDDRDAVVKQWLRDIEERKESLQNFRIVPGPGKVRWVQARANTVHTENGHLWGYVGSVKDVTDQRIAEENLRQAHLQLEERVEQRNRELSRANQWLAGEVRERRQVEEALRASEARWRALVENAPAFILLVDSQGIIQFINRARPGLSIEALTGRNIYDLVHPDTLPLFRERLEHCRATGEPTEFEAAGFDDNGGGIWYQTRVAPVSHDDQTDWLLVSTDITERHRAEERVRTQQAELAHVARIHTATELATGLAHEINQPLTAITSSAAAMLRFLHQGDSLSTADAVKIIEVIEEQARRAADVIRGLRDFVRKAPPSRVPADINALVDDTIAFMHHEARRTDVRIETDLQSDLPPLVIDSVQIQQVLVNLIKNACESMRETSPEDRTIQILTRRAHESGVEIAVVDQGTGIDGEIADQIFDSFFTTRSTGLGLGLCISRSLIEDHGGQLWMTPNARRGVTFHCRLPITGPTHEGK